MLLFQDNETRNWYCIGKKYDKNLLYFPLLKTNPGPFPPHLSPRLRGLRAMKVDRISQQFFGAISLHCWFISQACSYPSRINSLYPIASKLTWTKQIKHSSNFIAIWLCWTLKSIRKAALAGGCPRCAPPAAEHNVPLSFGSSTLWTLQDTTCSSEFSALDFCTIPSVAPLQTSCWSCWSSQDFCVLPTLGQNLWKKNLFGPKGEVLNCWIWLKALSLAVPAGDSLVEAAAAHTKSLLDFFSTRSSLQVQLAAEKMRKSPENSLQKRLFLLGDGWRKQIPKQLWVKEEDAEALNDGVAAVGISRCCRGMRQRLWANISSCLSLA